jgi:glycosyltransferase involved in cell wall biosynthesis
MLGSLHGQSYRPMQVVLWDDGSTDTTGQLAERWASRHTCSSFEVLFHQERENRGVCTSVSSACQLAKGVYWAFADQDDTWEAQKVGMEVELLEADTTTAIVFCDRQLVDSNDRILCESEYHYLGFTSESAEHHDFLRGRGRFSANAMLARGSAIESSLPIPAQLTSHDLYLTLSATRHGNARFIHQALLRYRIHGSNLSGNYGVESSRDYPQFRIAVEKLRKNRRRLRDFDAPLLAKRFGDKHPLTLWRPSRIEFLPAWALYCLWKLRRRAGRFARQ